ncbi:hypothetical protein GCM10029978_067240 [Actinoallomurus acanthiterrae]
MRGPARLSELPLWPGIEATRVGMYDPAGDYAIVPGKPFRALYAWASEDKLRWEQMLLRELQPPMRAARPKGATRAAGAPGGNAWAVTLDRPTTDAATYSSGSTAPRMSRRTPAPRCCCFRTGRRRWLCGKSTPPADP